jgi:purine-cytosine permease-like protein
MLPDYIARTIPRPRDSRAAWYANTAPAYAGVFLWIGFYQSIATGTLDRMSLSLCLLSLVVAAVLCFALYYYAPAMLGMKTGLPLSVVGSSTFGAKGGYLMPGLLMGVLQVGWYSVSTDLATKFVLEGLRIPVNRAAFPYILTAIIWAYTIAFVASMGIRYVARVAVFANIIPLIMIFVVFVKSSTGFSHYVPLEYAPGLGFILLIQIVTGFFATAGAAGTDFGMENRNARDIFWGGIVGICIAVLYAGGLTLLSMAGAHSSHPDFRAFTFDGLIGLIGGPLAQIIFFLYAIASIPGACFCSFIIGNSFSTMLPSLRRVTSTMAGVTVSIILAVTGAASHLVPFFQVIGASFGPICGAMLADYLLSGRRWAGPRQGVNWAGYGAWAAGFLVGMVPFLPLPEWKNYSQPATVYSAGAGFLVYWILAKTGFESRPIRADVLLGDTGEAPVAV